MVKQFVQQNMAINGDVSKIRFLNGIFFILNITPFTIIDKLITKSP